MATVNLSGKTSGSVYAAPGFTTYTNLPFNTTGSTTTNVTFFVDSNASIDILYNNDFRVDNTSGLHELFGNIEVNGASSDYDVSSWFGKVTLTHKTTGQTIQFQLTKPLQGPPANNSGVNVEFLDGAIAFTSNVNGAGVWSVWATTGGTDTSTWGLGGKANQLPATYDVDVWKATGTEVANPQGPLSLISATVGGYLNYAVNSSNVVDFGGNPTLTIAQVVANPPSQPYSISDTAANFTDSVPASVLNNAINISVTGTANVAEATVAADATNSGTTTVAMLADTAANIAASSNAVLGTVVGTVVANTSATVAQADTLAGFTHAVAYNVSDAADVVLAAIGTPALTDAASVTTTAGGAAISVADADALLALGNLNAASTWDISDVAANIVAGAALNDAVNIAVTDTATIAQATIVNSATNSGTDSIAAVADTAANIAGSSNAVLSAVTGTVTATTDATVAQATSIAGFTHAVTYDVVDEATLVVAAIGTPALTEAVSVTTTAAGAAISVANANALLAVSNLDGASTWDISDVAANIVAGAALNAATDITVTNTANVAQATIVNAATNSGTDSIASLADTTANLVTTTNAVLDAVAGTVTATDNATVAQGTTLSGFTHAVVYSVSDIAANMVAGAALNDAVNIAATGTATIAQATVVENATNSGTKAVAAVSDTAANIAASSDAVLDNVSGAVTASDSATVAEATTLAGFAHAITYNVVDQAALVLAAIGTPALTEAVSVTTTAAGAAISIANANALLAVGNLDAASTWDISDVAANIVAGAALNDATDITIINTVTVAQLDIVAAATNSGTDSFDSLTDSAANLATISNAEASEVVNAITATDNATAAQATIFAGFTRAAPVVFSISDYFTSVTSLLNTAQGTVAVNEAVNITANGDNLANVIDMGAFGRAVTVNGLGGNDNINTGTGNDIVFGGADNDTINVSSGADQVTAGTGADTVNLAEATAASDTVFQAVGDSVVRTDGTIGAGALAAGTTVVFGNGVDVINNFTAGAGGDVLSINVAGMANSAIGLSGTGVLANNTSWFVSGDWNAGNNTFTIRADGVGNSTMVFQGNGVQSLSTSTSAVVLVDVNSGTLVAGNFDGAARPALTAVLSGGVGNNTTLTLDGSSVGAVSVTPAGVLTLTDNGAAVAVTGGTYAAATLTEIDASEANITGGFTANIDGGVADALTTLRGADQGDNFIFASQDFGNVGTGGAIFGGAGTDTVTFTTVANALNITGTAANSLGLSSIENIDLTNGSAALVRLDGGTDSAVIVNNRSTTAAATVNLGTTQANTFTTDSAGVQTITVGQNGQTVTTGANNDDIIVTTTGLAFTSTFNGGNGANTLTVILNNNDTTNFSNATLQNLQTLRWVGNNASFVTIDEANLAAFTTAITGGGGVETLTLLSTGSGAFDFSNTAMTAVDVLTVTNGGNVITVDQTDVAGLGTIIGSAAGITTMTFNPAANGDLSGKAVTFLDTVTISGATAISLTLDGNDFSGTNYTTVTGDGDNDLILIGAAVYDLTDTAISGFDVLTTANATVVAVDAASIATGSALAWTASAATNLVMTEDYDATGWTLTGFQDITLAAGVDVTATQAFFNNTPGDAYNGNATGTLTVNMTATALNLSNSSFGITTEIQTTITGTAGNDTITFALDKAADSTMEVNGNGGNDSFRFLESSGNTVGNDRMVVADAVSINDFSAVGDQIIGNTGDMAGVLFTTGSVAAGALDWTAATPGFALITGSATNSFSTAASVYAAIGAVTTDGGDTGYVAIQNLAGTQVGIYQVQTAGALGGVALTANNSDVTLIAVLDVTGTFGAANLGLF